MMSVLLIHMTVSKIAETQFHTGVVAVILATAYALMVEHVKVNTPKYQIN